MADVKTPAEAASTTTTEAAPVAPPPSPESSKIASELKESFNATDWNGMSKEALIDLAKKAVNSSSELFQQNETLKAQNETLKVDSQFARKYEEEQMNKLVADYEKLRDEHLQAAADANGTTDLDKDPEISVLRNHYNNEIGLAKSCGIEAGREKYEHQKQVMTCSVKALQDKITLTNRLKEIEQAQQTAKDQASTVERMGQLFKFASGGVSTASTAERKFDPYVPSQPNVRLSTPSYSATPSAAATTTTTTTTTTPTPMDTAEFMKNQLSLLSRGISKSVYEHGRSGAKRSHDGRPLVDPNVMEMDPVITYERRRVVTTHKK